MKYTLIHQDVFFVNDGPIKCEKVDKLGFALGDGFLLLILPFDFNSRDKHYTFTLLHAFVNFIRYFTDSNL